MNRETWFKYMSEVTDRLNDLISKDQGVQALLALMFPCSVSSPVDVVQMNSLTLTNVIGVLNGILAFRDSKGLTYRISPVSPPTVEQPSCEQLSCKQLVSCKQPSCKPPVYAVSHCIIVATPSTEADIVFPLLPETEDRV